MQTTDAQVTLWCQEQNEIAALVEVYNDNDSNDTNDEVDFTSTNRTTISSSNNGMTKQFDAPSFVIRTTIGRNIGMTKQFDEPSFVIRTIPIPSDHQKNDNCIGTSATATNNTKTKKKKKQPSVQWSAIKNNKNNNNSNSNELSTTTTTESNDNDNNCNYYYYYGGVDVSFPNISTPTKSNKEYNTGSTIIMNKDDDDNYDDDNDQVDNNSSNNAADRNETNQQEAVAVYVIIDIRTMEIISKDYMFFGVDIPYIPNFLAFREIHPVVALINKQQHYYPHYTPRCILVDGNGILHIRSAGLACFVGVRTNIPTIGVGKTLYYYDPKIDRSKSHFETTYTCTDQDPIHHNNNNTIIKRSWSKQSIQNGLQQSLQDAIEYCSYFQQQHNYRNNDNSNSLRILYDPIPIGWRRDDTNKSANNYYTDQSTTTTINNPKNNISDIVSTFTTPSRMEMITILSQYVDAIAIPLAIEKEVNHQMDATSTNHDNNNTINNDNNSDRSVQDTPTKPIKTKVTILGCLLVGYGGTNRTKKTKQNNEQQQQKISQAIIERRVVQNPIYISVGHKMSLSQAIQICILLSTSRIPEPIRQADFLGRELLRHKEKERSTNNKV